MNTQLLDLDFHQYKIRVFQKQGVIWWILDDILQIFHHLKQKEIVDSLYLNDWGIYSIPAIPEPKRKYCINEFGLYTLISSLKTSESAVFLDWVKEKIPVIRQETDVHTSTQMDNVRIYFDSSILAGDKVCEEEFKAACETAWEAIRQNDACRDDAHVTQKINISFGDQKEVSLGENMRHRISLSILEDYFYGEVYNFDQVARLLEDYSQQHIPNGIFCSEKTFKDWLHNKGILKDNEPSAESLIASWLETKSFWREYERDYEARVCITLKGLLGIIKVAVNDGLIYLEERDGNNILHG